MSSIASTDRYRLRLITDTAAFAACRDEWNELAGERVFHRHEWMFAWWQSLGDAKNAQLAIVVIEDPQQRWVGLAPWYMTQGVARGRVVRQLASGSACSDYASLAVRPGYEPVVATVLANLISGNGHASCLSAIERFAGVDLYELEGYSGDDVAVEALLAELVNADVSTSTEEFAATWRSELPSTWSEYESRLHKSFRRKTRKAESRLRTDEFSAQVLHLPEQISQNWPVFVELHQRRRESLDQPGCFADPAFEQFLCTAATELAASGRAQLNIFHRGGEPLAANLEFITADSVFMYQTGMDPKAIQFEPGHITFTWAIQRSIERGFRYFDFLRGDEPYKARWKSSRVPLYRTRIVPGRIAARFRQNVWNAGRSVRNWTRSLVTRSSHLTATAQSESDSE